jgi:hypothetical protein
MLDECAKSDTLHAPAYNHVLDDAPIVHFYDPVIVGVAITQL